MSKWIAEFELEDGDTMPEHMDLEYKGAKIDFHCRPKEPILDKIRAEINDAAFDWQEIDGEHESFKIVDLNDVLKIINKYKAESEESKCVG